MVVQIFLVLGGYLAARSFSTDATTDARKVLRQLMRRYHRLVLPYLGALLLAIAGAAFTRSLEQHDSIPAAPSLPQLLAHLALIQGLLDYEALSAGVWYIAFDLQLFVLMLARVWIAQTLSGANERRRMQVTDALISLLPAALSRLPGHQRAVPPLRPKTVVAECFGLADTRPGCRCAATRLRPWQYEKPAQGIVSIGFH